MVGWRASLIVFGMVLMGLGNVTIPVAACHETADFCLPCQDTDDDNGCDLSSELDLVAIVGEVREYAYPEPELLSMHYDGLDEDERRGYLALQFEWATDDHMPPAGHGNVPFALEFSPGDGVSWDASTSSSFTFTVNDTRETLYFAFTAPDEEVEIGWRIVANPGPNQEEDSGTITYESFSVDEPESTFTLSFQRWWPAYLLFLLVGLLLGVMLGRRRPLP